MNNQFLTIVILLVVAAFVGWQYLMPSFDKVMELREEETTWQIKLSEMQELDKKLDILMGKYNKMTEEREKIEQGIPKGENTPGLMVELESLSSKNGMILNSVTFDIVDATKDKKAQAFSDTGAGGGAAVVTPQSVVEGVKSRAETPKAKILVVEMKLNGTYNAFRNFLRAVENNLRIMDVLALSFSGGGAGGTESSSAGQDFSLSLSTYFR